MNARYYLCILLTILGMGCKSIVDTPIGYDGDHITFGNGGGITGAVTSYRLLSNGQLFVSKGMVTEEWKQHSSIAKKEAQQRLDQSTLLGIPSLDHDLPGNTYKFIKVNIGNKENYICWGGGGQTIDDKISDFYFQLMEITK